MSTPYGGGTPWSLVVAFERLIAEHRARHPDPITQIKLTQDEMDEMKRTVPVVQYEPGQITGLLGIPVALVDKPEDSTLFTMTWESLVRRLREEQF